MKELLAFIRQHESRNNYNVVWAGIKESDRPKKPLVKMTIRQVLAWQDSIDPFYRSEAAGAYQILEDTLRGLYAEAGLTLDDLFDVQGQDRLAIQLLKRRGLKKFQSGAISAEQFANNIAKEWASMPMVTGPKKGKSFYDGDGLNKALIDVKPYMNAIRSCLLAQEKEVAPPKPQQNFFSWLLSLFGGKHG